MLRRKQQGFTFIEAIIAFMVLATSIIGVVSMQALSKKGSFDAVQRALATSLANDIVQRMRVNVAGVAANSYSGTFLYFESNSSLNRCRSAGSPCSSGSIAASDLYEWKMAIFGADVTQSGGNAGGLISPTACISHLAGAVSVVIAWSGRTETSDAAASKAEGSLAAGCGTASTKRRQVYIDTFIY
ncbi:MAG: type IV pilus assembly protein PilV [Phenylobacterium sp.]|jgi:type IV pilus assembly protein PilV